MTQFTRRRFTTALAGGSALLCAPALVPRAWAQAAYPGKPVRVIVPFPAGGGGDILARTALTRVGTELGQPIVFENMGGAGGNVGSAAAAKADPDGYTLLYGTNGTLAINRTLYRNPGFDPQRDLQPVSRLTQIGLVMVVRQDFPAATMPELLKMLKANPGKYTFGSAGNGTSSHLGGELLKAQAGVFVVHIPYRGGGAAITDLIGGQIDMMIEVMPNAVPHVKSGRLKALAVSTLARSDALPEVPTIAESGLPGFEVTAWDALMVPARTPPTVVAALNKAVRTALADPALVKTLAARGATVSPTSPDELGAFLKTEIDRWGAAIRRSGAQVD